MNTPKQQAELYRKAAETIEMCAKHGIEPMVKNSKQLFSITRNSIGYVGDFEEYEFPLAVIEGQLVWAGDKLYSLKSQGAAEFEFVVHSCNERGLWGKNGLGGTFDILSWKPSKQPLCEVEGKPVYADDYVYNRRGEYIKGSCITGANGPYSWNHFQLSTI